MPASSANLSELPAGPNVKGKLSRDDLIMRGGMAVIALYLIVTLAYLMVPSFQEQI
jgi:iron(III) transport system permease protein